MLESKVTAELKIKVFFRRAKEESQLEKQIQADYLYRRSLIAHEFIEINEGNGSATQFKERSCIRQLIKLIEVGSVDTLYVFDASRLTRIMADYMQFMAKLDKYNVRLVFTGSCTWEGTKIG